MVTRLGASRMSSVLGLKARPQTANGCPDRSSPNLAVTRSRRSRFWSSLTASTASRIEASAPSSLMVRTRAFTSFGKHEPP